MTQQATEKKEEQQEPEFQNIDFTNTSAYRTVKAWNTIAGIYVEGGQGGETGGIPSDEFTQLKRLRKLDAIVKPDKGPILKEITHMSRQIVRQRDSKGLLVPKEYLTILGEFKGIDFADMEVGHEFTEGWNKKPVMKKIYRTGKRFDSESGADLGTVEVSGATIEYFYELPKDAAKRKAYIDKIIGDNYPENIQYYYKELGPNNQPIGGTRDASFDYKQFTELSIDELRDLSKRGGGSKGSGYYWKDGKLYDKTGNPINK